LLLLVCFPWCLAVEEAGVLCTADCLRLWPLRKLDD
jgi:hypothetical protein